MDEPIVYVDQSRVRPGKLEELRAAIRQLAAAIEAGEPELPTYRAHLSEDGARITVIHVHRNSASLALHARVIAPLLAPFADLVELERIDLYGSPDEDVVARMREKARLLGTGDVAVHPLAAGFSRF